MPPTLTRALAALAATASAPLLAVALTAGPAAAHGATGNPPSRSALCGPEGGRAATSAACRAAAAVAGDTALRAEWDNVRVPDVAGRDREVIPDGQLCSAGLARFRGLDLARTDWPATALVPGAAFTFRYRETIAHKGTFRLYVTRDGYDPSRPLAWADLEARPFLTAVDPPLRNRSYTMDGRLPAGKAGRHLVYTIWQNSDTRDTYYSCSDVVFQAPERGARSETAAPPAAPSAEVPAAAAARRSPAAASPPPAAADGAPPAAAAPPAAEPRPVSSSGRDRSAAMLIVTGAVMLLTTAAGGVMVLLRRRRPDPVG